MGTTNVYRFVGVEQSLADARKAVQEERWEAAIAAAEALLREQPNHAEAQSIRKGARLELPNQQHYAEFVRAANSNEVVAALKHYRAIADGSTYRERARVVYEKMRQGFLDSQENEAKMLARAGRCDEARRAVRVANEWFPETRGRIDDAASGCRPPRGSSPGSVAGEETASASADKKAAAAEKEETPGASALLPLAAAPVPVANEASKAAIEPPRPVNAAAPVAAKTTVSAAPPPTPAPAGPARNVPATELERLRVAGDAMPALPAGAKMIAHRDGVKGFAVAIRYCVSELGVPTAVSLVKSSEYNDANEKIVNDVKRWRFRPYVQNGAPAPVCSATLLSYQIE